jgi:DnaJ-class molecular chaperone
MNVVAIVVALSAVCVVVCDDSINHYTVLGIDKTASTADVRKAYRALAIALHPDKNVGDENAAK